jgi:hypothetical protein
VFKIKKASRANVKLRIGFFGPSGSGKTMSALKFAKGLVGDWSKIAVLDTENGSSELYSHLGEFQHVDFKAPYDPRNYIKAINFIGKNADIDCLIIDSISHEWDGEGGCLELHESAGGGFRDWAKVTPLHKQFIQTMLQAPFHVIVCGRTKIDYALSQDVGKNGKTKHKVEKVGLKTITREGFDYELTLSFSLNQDHLALKDKDRTNLFDTQIPFLIDEEIGEKVKEWNDRGEVREPDYKQLFQKQLGEIAEYKSMHLAYLKAKVPYEKENEDNDYWKQKLKELKEIDIEEMKVACM